MRKFLNAVVLIPLGLVLVVFAVANRHPVTISFDPFHSQDPSLGFTLPLFAVIIAVAILGVVAGGLATWFGQRRWRRAARRHEADAREMRAQLANLRTRASAPEWRDPPPLAGPGQGPYGAGGRDKQGATL